jgi:hypothetical protein
MARNLGRPRKPKSQRKVSVTLTLPADIVARLKSSENASKEVGDRLRESYRAEDSTTDN